MNPSPIKTMRIPEYLSPSAISLWEKSVEDYYLKYLTLTPPPRDLQTQPMSIGSSFDAYCKSYLHEKLFGTNHTDSNKFGLKAIFEAQVEEQHRDWAWKHGQYVFNMYKESGCLKDFLIELNTAQNEPRFEFELRGMVSGVATKGDKAGEREPVEREMNGVVFLGKPDCAYINKSSNHIVHDWKVSGYCSKSQTSPMPGYVRIRGKGKTGGQHPDAHLFEVGGMTINIAMFLENKNVDWARQLSIYAWLLNEPIGGDYILSIDQVVCKPGKPVPELRFAEHRLRVSADFQWMVFRRACEIMDIIRSGHIFRDMTLEESQARGELLDKMNQSLYSGNSPEDQLFREMTQR